VTTERVLDDLAACAFSNMAEFCPAPGERIDLSSMDRRLTAAVSHIEIEETIVPGKNGEAPALLRRRTKLKLHNKIAALEALGKHLGLFAEPKRDSPEEQIRRMTPEERYLMVKQTLEEARRRYAYLLENRADESQEGVPGRGRQW
jgi:phage terminase small subunit